jgi:membrane protein implicated in regulation of membrane protease activity
MAAWLVWLIAAGALGVAELLTLTLAFGMLSASALGAALAASLGAPAALQVLTFVVVALLLLVVVRPIATRHARTSSPLRTGTAALIGSRGVAVTDIDRDHGQVRLGGEVWSARPYGDGGAIPAGASVDVVEIDGVTAVVLPTELP